MKKTKFVNCIRIITKDDGVKFASWMAPVVGEIATTTMVGETIDGDQISLWIHDIVSMHPFRFRQ